MFENRGTRLGGSLFAPWGINRISLVWVIPRCVESKEEEGQVVPKNKTERPKQRTPIDFLHLPEENLNLSLVLRGKPFFFSMFKRNASGFRVAGLGR